MLKLGECVGLIVKSNKSIDSTFYSNPIPEQSNQFDSVKWEPFTIENQKYMDIGNKLVLNERLFEERYAEWEKLFPLSQYT